MPDGPASFSYVVPGSSPPVVLITQTGTAGKSWQPVIDLLTCRATTVTYDRPGTGDRPPRPAPNPALPYSAFADELAALLNERGITEPAVIVGHSVGSLIARMFTARYPERTAGVVHVDGSIPRLSLWPAMAEDQGPNGDGDGPDATAFDLLAGEIEIVEGRIPVVPAAVVTRAPGWWPPTLPPAPGAPRLWTAYQRQLARQHGCPLVVARSAGHQIPTESPSLVAYLIDQVRTAVRSGGRCTLDTARLTDVDGYLDETH